MTEDGLWLLAGPDRSRPPTRRSPSRPRGLTRDLVISAAIRIADAEGAEAVSMRRVARELEVSPMALYWHVADKDELHALMVDAVEGEIEIPPPTGDWRADLTATARRYRQVLLAHGWMTRFIGMRRSLGPNELPHIENSLAALDGVGISVRHAFSILMAIETYYLGFALREQQELTAQAATQHVTPAQRKAFLVSESERLRHTDRYPHLAALFEGGDFVARDERFEFGLARLLDGIEADLPTRVEPGTTLD